MKALARFVGAVPDHDHPIELHDLLLEAEQLIAERGKAGAGNLRHPFVTRVGNNVEQFGYSFAPDRRDDAKFGKVSPDRINHRGLLANKQMPCAVKHQKQSSSPLGKRNTPSPAVVTEGGKTIWLAGHVGFVDDSGASLTGNFDAQTRQAFKNLEKTLQRAGGTLKDIVWMTVSVSDGRYSQRFTDIRKEIYGKEFPASTLLTAAAFAVPEIMVEITAIAVVAA